jgi:apurinic endonuclease APN1
MKEFKNSLIGAHLSAAGGYVNALYKLKEIGGNCLQLFASPPRNWTSANPTGEQEQAFLTEKDKLTLTAVYFHATYLINLADDGQTGEKSKKILIEELQLASKLGVLGSVVHLGSFKEKLPDEKVFREHPKHTLLLRNISHVLEQTPSDAILIIENAGTHKIGASIAEIGFLVKSLRDKRVRVCLDTCHLHAAGFDLSTMDKLNLFLETFDQLVGIECLELFHANDSKDGLGSYRDRHENIGEGKVGNAVFRNLLNHEMTKSKPFILEVPGFDKKGPDQTNVDRLRSLL